MAPNFTKFPNAPTVGQVFNAAGSPFMWSGTAWLAAGAVPIPVVPAAEAAARGPK